jgi:hypothetical protein
MAGLAALAHYGHPGQPVHRRCLHGRAHCRRHQYIDGCARPVDGHVFVERRWRSLKHEDSLLEGLCGRPRAPGIGAWIAFYNTVHLQHRASAFPPGLPITPRIHPVPTRPVSGLTGSTPGWHCMIRCRTPRRSGCTGSSWRGPARRSGCSPASTGSCGPRAGWRWAARSSTRR